ncbi:MAG: PP2C family protein-serine/threonine phosphatase [Shimia sp.]
MNRSESPSRTAAGASARPITAATEIVSRILFVGRWSPEHQPMFRQLDAWGFALGRERSVLQAVERMDRFVPDVIVLHLPSLDLPTPEAIAALRARTLPHRPYIVVTAAPMELPAAEHRGALGAGADHAIGAGFEPEMLRAILRAADALRAHAMDQQVKTRRIQQTLTALQEMYDLLDGDLLEARKMQQALVPENCVEMGRGRLSMLLRAAGHVGGDMTGQFRIDEEMLGFYGIDVSGHGISSALMTARLAGYFPTAAPERNIALRVGPRGAVSVRPLAETVEDLNARVMADVATEHYFTLFLAIANMRTGHVRAAQAGHPHPLIQRADGRIEAVGGGGLPVGLIPGARYETFQFRLRPGDRLLVASDGFTECTRPDGGQVGDDGLEALLAGLHGQPGPQMLDALLWRLAGIASDDGIEDDLSALLLEMAP